MVFKWESRVEKIKRYMKIPARKKMEWLALMNSGFTHAQIKKFRTIREKLRAYK